MATLDPKTIFSPGPDIHVARVALVITITVLVYDYLLTIGEEKGLVWPSRFTFVKLLFLLNRYSPFIGTAGLTYVFISFRVPDDSKFCRPTFWVFGGVVMVEYLLAELILYSRTYAIYGRKKLPLFLLGISGLVSWTFGGVFAVRFLKTAQVIPSRSFRAGCIISLEGHVDMLGFIALLVSETIALLALLIRAFQMPGSMTLKRISADGINFYIVILCATIVNVIVLNVAPPAVCNFMIAPQAALHSICCNRLLLRIRKNALNVEDALPSPPNPCILSSRMNGNGIEMHSYQSQRRESFL